jgi:hypothetical protein
VQQYQVDVRCLQVAQRLVNRLRRVVCAVVLRVNLGGDEERAARVQARGDDVADDLLGLVPRARVRGRIDVSIAWSAVRMIGSRSYYL